MVRSLTVGQLAKRAGTTAKAVRYYEGLGLLDPAPRAVNSYRLYDAGALDRLLFIRRAKLLGVSLSEIRELLHEVPGGCQHLQGEVEELLTRKIEQCRQQIGELAELQRSLEERRLILRSKRNEEIAVSPLSPRCACLPVDPREVVATS
ncbi:MAG: MerR family DNA-binding protein [Chloroflexi bacterium]|nr:MerR family DNA-binding protein [Chloroflexota bacterium]